MKRGATLTVFLSWTSTTCSRNPPYLHISGGPGAAHPTKTGTRANRHKRERERESEREKKHYTERERERGREREGKPLRLEEGGRQSPKRPLRPKSPHKGSAFLTHAYPSGRSSGSRDTTTLVWRTRKTQSRARLGQKRSHFRLCAVRLVGSRTQVQRRAESGGEGQGGPPLTLETQTAS